jgi:DNA-binding IclR family transcriptional regulator
MNPVSARNRPSRKTSPQTYAIPALEKGLDVLELLSQARHALGLNEIAATLHRSRQELFRVVTCLSMRGYLLRDATGEYRLSSKMLEVGSRHMAQQLLISLAMPAMEALAEATGESCQLLLIGRERLLVVATAAGPAHLQLDVKVGSSIELYNSVVGWIVLAFASQNGEQASWERRREIQREGGDVFEPGLRSFTEWRDRLGTIRRDGYVMAQSSVHSGARICAGPLLNAENKLMAVLSSARVVAVREERRRDVSISTALVDCCRKISAGLGAVDEAAMVDGHRSPPRKTARRRGAGRKIAKRTR